MPKSKPAETPRKGVNTRITDELRAMLEAAATESGRSVGAEIERRLADSFKPQPDLYATVRAAIQDERAAEYGKVLSQHVTNGGRLVTLPNGQVSADLTDIRPAASGYKPL